MKRTIRSFNSTLNKKSDGVKARDKRWQIICLKRITWIIEAFGYLLCEYCGGAGNLIEDDFNQAWGHHIDWERNNCTKSNVMIVHNRCNTHIHDNNEHPEQLHFVRKDGAR